MMAPVTDSCPSNSYHSLVTVLNGEYDGSTLDYLLGGTVGLTPDCVFSLIARLSTCPTGPPRITDEVMLLYPSSAASPGQLSLENYSDGAVNSSYWAVGLVGDSPQGYKWSIGTTEVEDARNLAEKQARQAAMSAPDACGTPTPRSPDLVPDKYWGTVVPSRLVHIGGTCTEAAYQRVSSSPSYTIGGSQFLSTCACHWLIELTATREDGVSVMALIPAFADGEPAVGKSASLNASSRIGTHLPGNLLASNFALVPERDTVYHDYTITWSAV
jgi:hypothetical protein